ncbi:lactosylceramide 4-alpha-galactosyltransferase-like [Neocloeon triangulifer]|uniref:lactosylceramide 4-alpha-galactosyltransferase-like n=1 Tax=Neocloeon triangulifer TaxID=2078957 RepID=UPI00286F90A9|nr:lactosylceramide 4-alpha-galactosyltransferase-like [Neocloeon triangulifer]
MFSHFSLVLINVIFIGGFVCIFYLFYLDNLTVPQILALPIFQVMSRFKENATEDTIVLPDITWMALTENGLSEFDKLYGPRVIFFIETSGTSRLNPRVVCAVESAAKTNPKAMVLLLLTHPVRMLKLESNRALIKVLANYTNVKVVTMDSTQILLESNYRSLVEQDKHKNSNSINVHTSDFLRNLMVLIFGGIYFDTDYVIVNDLSPLFEQQNFIPYSPSGDLIGNYAFGFRRQHPLLQLVVKKAAKHFDPKVYISGLIAYVKGVCEFYNLTHIQQARDAKKLGDVLVLNSTVLTPLDYPYFEIFYHEGKAYLAEQWIKSSLAVHLWNQMNLMRFNLKLEQNSTAPYAALARQFCPVTFANSGKLF